MKRRGYLIACLLLVQQAIFPMGFAASYGAPQDKQGPSVTQDAKGNVTEKGTDKNGNPTTETWTRDDKGNITHTKDGSDAETTPPAGQNNYNGTYTTKNGDETTTTKASDGTYTTKSTDKEGTVTITKGQKDARGKEMGKQEKIIRPKKGHAKKIVTEFDKDGKAKKDPDVFEQEFMSNTWKPVPAEKPEEKPGKKDNGDSSFDGTGDAASTSALVGGNVGQTVEGLVLPSRVSENQAFTFDAQGAVSGEVVQIQTLSGEVVASKTSDDRGRVVVGAGVLAAGLYEVIKGSGTSARRCGQMTIQPRIADVPAQVSRSMQISSLPPLRIGSLGTIGGQGFSPKAADMVVRLGEKSAMVLAATDSELKLAPISANPGTASLHVENGATGETASANVMCYSLAGKLSQEQILSGSRTMLMISVEPKNLPAQGLASIASGPVAFDGGHRQMTVPIRDGVGRVPLYSRPGSAGAFQVTFALAGLANEYGGQTIRQPHQDGSSTTIDTDKNGHLMHEAKFDKDGNLTDDTSWEYDGSGRMRKKVHIHWNPDGGTTKETKTWDEGNRPTSSSTETRDKDGHQTSGSKSSTTYDGKSDHKGTTTNETYDPKTGTYK